MSYVLFVSEDKLKDSTAINGNVDVDFLLPYVKISQKIYVETKLGTDLYQKLEAEITAGTLAGAYKTLVDEYIGDMLCQWAFYECIPFLRFKIQNGNIYSKTSENGTAISDTEASSLREEIRNTAEYYTERLINYLRFNNASFPEYSTSSGADVKPNTDAYFSGMNLSRSNGQGNKLTLRNFLTSDLT